MGHDIPQLLVVNLNHQLGLFAIVVVVLTALSRYDRGLPLPLAQALRGLVFGGAAIAGMADPVTLAPGVITDARSVMVALSGPFGGPIGAVMCAALAGSYRWWLGGAGALPGIVAISWLALGSILLARRVARSGRGFGVKPLALLAAYTTLVTSATFLLLPLGPEAFERLYGPIAISNATGIAVLGLFLYEQDRNRRLQAHVAAALRETTQLAERHRIITDNVADGIVTVDAAGTIQTFNSSAEWMFGYAAREAIGQPASLLLRDSDGEPDFERRNPFMRRGRAQAVGELRGRRKDGTVFPLEVQVAEFRLDGTSLFTASLRDLTARRAAEQKRMEAEEKLRASEVRFRDFAEASSDYLWESDVEHRFTSIGLGSASPKVLVGRRMLGQTRWEAAEVDPAAEPWATHLVEVAARRPFKDFVFSKKSPSGRTHWIRTSGKPVFDEAGAFVGYRGASSDITDSIVAQQQLQARAQQQQALALLGQQALRDHDPDRLFEAAAAILARTFDAPLVGRFDSLPNRTELVLGAGIGWEPGAIGRERVPYCPSSLAGAAFLSPGPLVMNDIRLHPTITPSNLSDEHGIRAGMAAGIGDLAARSGSIAVYAREPRRFRPEEASFLQALAFILGAANERREAEASLRLRDRALQAIGQGLIIADATVPGWPVVYANPLFERTSGLPADAIRGRSVTDIFASKDDFGLADRIRRDLRGAGTFSARLSSTGEGGGKTWDDVTISKVYDEAGRPTHYVVVQTDVTQRVKLESELQQAQKMDAVGKLTGGVAHDFNNLLTVIMGNAEVIVEDLHDPQLKSCAAMVLDAAERGSDLVQRLLTFGRRQALEPEFFSVDHSVENLAALLRRTLGKDIAFRTELGCGARTAFVDRSQLETAILNLVTNARDAMKGGGTLTVATRPVAVAPEGAELGPKPGAYLALVVSDTGSGMPADVKERAFEPFFTTKEVGKGTGLGLSTVYGFVQQSGGHVRIDTALGRGTSIEILLPEASGEVVERGMAVARSAETGGERILVVEDQDDVRAFVTAQLASFGYDVVSAACGPSAIDALRRDGGIRLLFSDILLPAGLDGIELAENALAIRPSLKVLFTSGYSDYAVERRSRLLDNGMPLLKKPYRRLELASAVRDAIDRRS